MINIQPSRPATTNLEKIQRRFLAILTKVAHHVHKDVFDVVKQELFWFLQ